MTNLFVRLTILIVLSGCTLEKRLAKKLPTTFLEDVDIKSRKANLPFDHAWVKAGASKAGYESVYFKPIRIDLLPQGEWIQSSSPTVSSVEQYREKAAEIAQYFRSELIDKTSKQENGKLAVTRGPGSKTLVIDIALTELELSHPVARAGAIFSPVPGADAAISSISDPHVAFAARLTDGSTGKLLATVADRKFAPSRLMDVNKLTVSSSAREVCALWADTIAQALQGNEASEISETNYEILPW